MGTALLRAFLVLAAVGMTACSGTDEQAIRHVVIAEFIERNRVPESHIEILEIRLETQDSAVTKVKVEGPGGRSDESKSYRCELKRVAYRWVVQKVERE